MKILFCNYEYPPLGGGGGVVMAAVARCLAKRHSVTVLTSRAMDLAPESDDAGVRVIRVPVLMRRELATASMPSMLSYVPTAIWKGLRISASGSFDVINTHFAVPTGPVGQLLARVRDVPNILSVHGGDLYDPSKSMSPHRHAWLRGPIRALLRSANVVVAQSKNTAYHVATTYGVKRDVELIPLGIERPPRMPQPSRASYGIPADAVILVTVGRLVARKSITQLVTAMNASGKSNLHLLVVGSGPDEQPLRAAAAAAGLADRIHLLGQVTDAEKYAALGVADLFVSTSQHEGFGLVFLEAMAFGLPVICYDEGGQTDFLATGETGFVVRLNDIGAFAQALAQVAGSAELRKRLSAHNLAKVEHFFIDRCAERHEALFDAVIRAAKATAGLPPGRQHT